MFEAVEGSIYVTLFVILYFEVFLLVTAINRIFVKKQVISERKISFGKVSIIVPCLNEEKTLAKTVKSLLALDYPKDKFEILIVNDGSTDGTKAIAERFLKFKNVKVFNKENGGKYSALNLGLEHAKGDFVACLDADSYVEPMALQEIIKRFDDEDTMAVTPAIKVHEPNTILQYVQNAEYIISIFIRNIFATLGVQFITPGPFSTYRKEVFDKIGNFRNAYNTEDLELGLRMQRNNLFIDNTPIADVYTNVPSTFIDLIKQRVRWAYGFINNAIHYRDLFFNPKKNFCLGFIILPTVLASIVGGLYVVLFFVINGLSNIIKFAVELYAIKALPHFAFPQIDLFFAETNPMIFLMFSLLLLTLILFMIGSYTARINKPPMRDISLYLLLYGILAPIWLTKAIYDAAVVRKNNWR